MLRSRSQLDSNPRNSWYSSYSNVVLLVFPQLFDIPSSTIRSDTIFDTSNCRYPLGSSWAKPSPHQTRKRNIRQAQKPTNAFNNISMMNSVEHLSWYTFVCVSYAHRILRWHRFAYRCHHARNLKGIIPEVKDFDICPHSGLLQATLTSSHHHT